MSLVCNRCGRAVSENIVQERHASSQKVHVNIRNLSQKNDADIMLQDKEIKNRIVEARDLFEKSGVVVAGGMLNDEKSKEKYTCNNNKISVSSITNRFFRYHR